MQLAQSMWNFSIPDCYWHYYSLRNVKALSAFGKFLAASRKRKNASKNFCSIAYLHSTSSTCQQQQQQQLCSLASASRTRRSTARRFHRPRVVASFKVLFTLWTSDESWGNTSYYHSLHTWFTVFRKLDIVYAITGLRDGNSCFLVFVFLFFIVEKGVNIEYQLFEIKFHRKLKKFIKDIAFSLRLNFNCFVY